MRERKVGKQTITWSNVVSNDDIDTSDWSMLVALAVKVIVNLLAATTFLCLSCTPFGAPVDPEVYITQQMSSGSGGVGSLGLLWPVFCNSSKLRMLRWGCASLSFSMSPFLASLFMLL